MFFTPQASTRDKAVNILQTLIDSRKSSKSYSSKILVNELNSYKNAIGNVEQDHSICKFYILFAILDLRLKAGQAESEALFEEINSTATKIIDLYNTENPNGQQFNNMPELCYTYPNMQPANWNA